MTAPKASLNKLLSGPISSIAIAKKVRLPALYLTTLGAFIWAIIAINGLFASNPYGYWSIGYSVALFLVALGLYKMRKEAAIFALMIALISLLSGGGYLKIAADIVALLVAVGAIRGTLAYSLITRQAKAAGKST